VGRKFDSEQAELTLQARFADQRGVRRLDQLSAGVIDDFLASRPRTRPRSFNHLLGVVTGLLNWAVTQEMLDVPQRHWLASVAGRLTGCRCCSTSSRLVDCSTRQRRCRTT
jgi:hypothetical protein